MTITNDIGGKKGKFKATRKPVLFNYDPKTYNLDPELRRLDHLTVKKTQDNCEYCFWSDSVSQSFAQMTSATIRGTGLRIKAAPRIKEIVEGFNEEINVGRQTIADYYDSTWIDALTHAGSFWRVDEDHKEYPYNVDIQRIDPKTLTLKKDPGYGWRMYVQQVGVYKTHRSKRAFYSKTRLQDPQIETFPYYRNREIYIADEPHLLLRNQFFIRPPIASALHYITYKKYILYFMRKFSQKYWTPFILFLIGDPKTNYYPDTDEEMQERIDDLNELVPEMSNFSGLVTQGDVRAEELGKQSARGSEIYVTYMDALDKQIMMALFGSMGIRSSSGNELSTQRGLKEGYYQFLEGARYKYKTNLEKFYIKALLPANGIRASKGDVEIEYPPLKFEASEEIMRSIEIGRNTGMFKDRNELRKAGSTIWNWLDPVEESSNGKIDFKIPSPTNNATSGVSLSQNDKQRNKSKSSTTTI